MYQPRHGRFVVQDPSALLVDLSTRIPAVLVTQASEGFRTTILPMLFDAEGDGGWLRGHIARGNPQWRSIEAEDAAAIAIFNAADAYVTPSWYPEKQRTGRVVPTWNYTTLVAHGMLTTRHEPEWLLAHVRRLVDRHEALRTQPWSIDDAPDDYISTQARAIVGIELRIERIEAKRKLSQNRSADDIAGVIEGLGAGLAGEQSVARDMRDVVRNGE